MSAGEAEDKFGTADANKTEACVRRPFRSLGCSIRSLLKPPSIIKVSFSRRGEAQGCGFWPSHDPETQVCGKKKKIYTRRQKNAVSTATDFEVKKAKETTLADEDGSHTA